MEMFHYRYWEVVLGAVVCGGGGVVRFSDTPRTSRQFEMGG